MPPDRPYEIVRRVRNLSEDRRRLAKVRWSSRCECGEAAHGSSARIPRFRTQLFPSLFLCSKVICAKDDFESQFLTVSCKVSPALIVMGPKVVAKLFISERYLKDGSASGRCEYENETILLADFPAGRARKLLRLCRARNEALPQYFRELSRISRRFHRRSMDDR